jgi:hypothetical protein
MLMWQDIFTDDEVISDAYQIQSVHDVEGKKIPGMLMAVSKSVSKGGYNTTNCDDFVGNDQDVDDNVELINNIIDDIIGFGYTETDFDNKAELKNYLKTFFSKIVKQLKFSGADDEKIEQVNSDAPQIIKYLVSQFDDLQFYMFKSCDSDAGLAYAYYPEGAITPVFLYIKWGLKQTNMV